MVLYVKLLNLYDFGYTLQFKIYRVDKNKICIDYIRLKMENICFGNRNNIIINMRKS